MIVQAAGPGGPHRAAYSAHRVRTGFVIYAHIRGASDPAMRHQTRHRSLATLGEYVRVAHAPG